MRDLVLAIDQGTTGTTVLVVDKTADFFRFMNGPGGGGRQPAPQR